MYFGVANHKTTCVDYTKPYLGRRLILFACFFIIFAFFIFQANFKYNMNICSAEPADPPEDIESELTGSADEIISNIDFSELDDILSTLETDDLFNGKTFKEYVKDVISGNDTFDISSFFQVIKILIRSNLKSMLVFLTMVLVVALMCSVFTNLRSEKVSGAGEAIDLVCFSVIVIILSVLLASLIRDSKDTIMLMQKQMSIIFPILLTLMSSMGANISMAAYTPVVSVLSNVISTVFCYVLLPMFSVSLVLSIVGHISSNTKLGKLNSFIKSTFKWIIGTVFAVFMGYLTIKGFTAGASDGISIKATKFAIKNYIPMLGGYISDGFEIVKISSMVVKNAVGFSGIIILIVTALSPIVAIAICELSLKLLSGILEPLGGNKVSSLLSSIAGSLKLLVVIIIGIALMYFLTIYLMTLSVMNIF